MLDAVYIATAIAFFAVMLAYVHGCEALGRSRDDGEERPS